jgi:hypothetical protein
MAADRWLFWAVGGPESNSRTQKNKKARAPPAAASLKRSAKTWGLKRSIKKTKKTAGWVGLGSPGFSTYKCMAADRWLFWAVGGPDMESNSRTQNNKKARAPPAAASPKGSRDFF